MGNCAPLIKVKSSKFSFQFNYELENLFLVHETIIVVVVSDEPHSVSHRYNYSSPGHRDVISGIALRATISNGEG